MAAPAGTLERLVLGVIIDKGKVFAYDKNNLV